MFECVKFDALLYATKIARVCDSLSVERMSNTRVKMMTMSRIASRNILTRRRVKQQQNLCPGSPGVL